METWKSLPFSDIYMVSDMGNIKRVAAYKNKRAYPTIKGYVNKRGYRYVSLWIEGKLRSESMHRLVMLTFAGLPNGRVVNHKNGNKDDNRLNNLEYLTNEENVKHARYVLRAYKKGSAHHFAKLNENSVRFVRAMLADGNFSHQEIADSFGVSRPTITLIATKKNWAHLK